MRWSLGCWLAYTFLPGLVGTYSTRKIVICSVEVGVDYCSVVVFVSAEHGNGRNGYLGS